MEIELQIEFCQNSGCKYMTVYEKTGAYNPNSNEHGWGIGTETDPVATLSAVLRIYMPGGDPALPVVIDVHGPTSGFWPTVDTMGGINISNVMLGLQPTETLPDGLWEVEYEVVYGNIVTGVEDIVVNTSCTMLFTCNVRCCLDNLFIQNLTNVEECCTGKISKGSQKLRMAYIFLYGAERAAACGKPKRAMKLLEDVQAICLNQDCNCK